MQFESRPSQCIDTFIPNSECSVKLNAGSNGHGILDDRKSTFLAKNSQSLNFQSELNVNQINTYTEKYATDMVRKRLQSENQQKLEDFARTYIFFNDQIINIKNPPSESLRTNVKNLLEFNGVIFIGETDSENRKQGKGIQIQIDGSYYFGDFSDNHRNGLGTFVAKNYERYEGEFKVDEQIGKGTYFYLNGDQYIGQFINGMKHGQGKMIYYEMCATFIGEFSNDKREGQGLLLSLNGNVIQDGTFKDDNFFSSKSLKSHHSQKGMHQRSTIEGLDQSTANKNADLELKTEINQIELIPSETKLSKEQINSSQQQDTFKMTMQRGVPQNNCCCNLFPFDFMNFFRIS